MTRADILKDLTSEKSLAVPSRFPCRAIMVHTIAEYFELLNDLTQLCDVTISPEDLGVNNDTFPQYDALADRLATDYNGKWLLLPGVSEYLRLFVKGEEKRPRFFKLWRTMLGSESTTRVIIPLWDCEAQWQRINLSADERQADFFLRAGTDEIAQRMTITVLSNAFDRDAINLNQDANVKIGMNEWMWAWADTNNPVEAEHPVFMLVTRLWPNVESCNGDITIHVVSDAFTFIAENAKDGRELRREWCSNEMLQLLIPAATEGKTVREAILQQLNMQTFDEMRLMSEWQQLPEVKRQLAMLWMRLNDTHSYIHYCFMKAAEIKDIPSLIQGEVFDVFKNRPDWIEEYKKAATALAMPRGAGFFKALNAIPTWEQQLSFLTGESVEERIEIIRLIGRAIQRFNVDGKTLADMVRPIYPSFADYISMNDTGVEGLSHYFQQYKRHKLANTLPTDPEFLLGLVSTDNFDYRYAAMNPYLSGDWFVLWIDGLGAEWYGYLLNRIKRECDDSHTIEHSTIAQATLPTETCYNAQWNEMEKRFRKLDTLDKLAHHGVVDNPDYYACVEAQLRFIDSVVDQATALIKQHQRVIITGDHGASRLAARAFHEGDMYKLLPPAKAKVCSLGRYCKLTQAASTHSDVERPHGEYLVITSYDHYVSSGNAAGYNDEETATYGELHGGATPEEMLVPVIVLKSKDIFTPATVKFNQISVKRKPNKDAVFTAEFSRPVAKLKVRIGNNIAVCTQNDGTGAFWNVCLHNAEKGKYTVEVEADNCQIDTDVQLAVIAAGLVEDDLFGV